MWIDQITGTSAANETADRNYADAIQRKADFNQHITESRRRFWAAYPNSPDLAKVRQEFVHDLMCKDYYYLEACLQIPHEDRADDFTHFKAVLDATDLLGIGPADGGIPKSAQGQFIDWASRVETEVGLNANRMNFFSVPADRAAKALADSEGQYAAYAIVRDWAEFDAAHREPAGSENPIVYATLLFARYDRISITDAAGVLEAMIDAVGKEDVLHAAEKVHAAHKNSDHDVADVTLLGLTELGTVSRRDAKGNVTGEDTWAPAPKARFYRAAVHCQRCSR